MCDICSCVYILMCICMQTYINVFTYTCVYMCNSYVCIYTCVHVCRHIFMCIYCTHMCICVGHCPPGTEPLRGHGSGGFSCVYCCYLLCQRDTEPFVLTVLMLYSGTFDAPVACSLDMQVAQGGHASPWPLAAHANSRVGCYAAGISPCARTAPSRSPACPQPTIYLLTYLLTYLQSRANLTVGI